MNHIKFHRRAIRFLVATHFLRGICETHLRDCCVVNAASTVLIASRAKYRRRSTGLILASFFLSLVSLFFISSSRLHTSRSSLHPRLLVLRAPLGVSYELNVPRGFWGPVDPIFTLAQSLFERVFLDSAETSISRAPPVRSVDVR